MKRKTPEATFQAVGVSNSDIGKAFRREMEGREYGESALAAAWAWFLKGYKRGKESS